MAAPLPFFEHQLDPCITDRSIGGPTVPGRIKRYTANGRLSQSFNSAVQIHRYDVAHGIRSREDFQTVLDLWYVVMFTPYAGFRFKDWRDYRATRENTKLTLVSGSIWQLQRRHVAGGIEFLRDIVKPCAAPAIVIYDAGGTPLTATVDTTTGRADVTGTPATWTGQFDVPVTFSDDEWAGTSVMRGGGTFYATPGAIQLEEIKL